MYNEQILFNLNARFPARISGDFTIEKVNSKVGKVSSFHFHDEYEFLYIKTGCMKCITDDGEHFAYPGDIIFVNSRVPHSTYNEVDGSSDCLLQFKSPVSIKGPLRYVARFLKSTDTQCCVFKKGSAENDEITSYMKTVMEYNKNKNEAYEYYITAHLYMIMGFLHKHNIISKDANFTGEKHIERIMPVLEYIDQNYSEQISLEQLSDHLNLNPSYFCRLFKKAIGSTFTEYLNFVRVCKAEHLLKHGSNISDTAYSVGFSSLSYFNRVFKKYKFCSPSDYKKISRKHGHLMIDTND